MRSCDAHVLSSVPYYPQIPHAGFSALQILTAEVKLLACYILIHTFSFTSSNRRAGSQSSNTLVIVEAETCQGKVEPATVRPRRVHLKWGYVNYHMLHHPE